MSVGGKIIEKKPVHMETSGKKVIRYTVQDGSDVTKVRAEPSDKEPKVGDSIWWQGDKIYWDGDKQTLTKVGNSY